MAIMSPVLPIALQEQLLERAGTILADAAISDARISFEQVDTSSGFCGMLVIRTSMYNVFGGLYMRDIYKDEQRRARNEIHTLCEEMLVQYKADPLE